LSPASRSRLRNSRFVLDFPSGHANSLTLLLPTNDEQRRNQTLNSDSPIRSRSQRTTDEASDHRARSGNDAMPKAKPGKQRKAHDEKRSKKPSAAWEALVGSFTSNEPNLAKRPEEILRAELGGDLGRLRPCRASGRSQRSAPPGAPSCSALQPRNCSCLSKPGTSEVHRHCSAPVKPAFGRVLAHRDQGPAEAL
jgi:hypothetical protein